MKRLFRIVQFGGNLGIIILALLLTFLAFDQYLISTKKADEKALIASNSVSTADSRIIPNLIGSVFPLQNIDWKESNKTVVLYLSTTCRFCIESSPFYRHLVKAKKNNNDFRLVTIFQQSADEGNVYLQANDIEVDKIISASLSSIGVIGTPSLILIDSNGVVVGFWRGKLDEKKEAEVLSML